MKFFLLSVFFWLISLSMRAQDTIAPTGDHIVCDSAGITLHAEDGFDSYRWQNGYTGKNIYANISGAYHYSATVRGVTTFSDTSYVTISTRPDATIHVAGKITVPYDINLDLSVAKVGGYIYSWNSGVSTTNTIHASSAGIRRIVITNAFGCVAMDSIKITPFRVIYPYNKPPAPPVCSMTVSGSKTDVSIHGGSDGAITTIVHNGTPPYAYLWNDAVTTANRSGLVKATYTVTVTDNVGCTATHSFNITQPPCAVTVSGVITNVSTNGGNDGAIVLTVGGGIAPYTFMWNDAVTTQNRSGLVAGRYSVIVTDNVGCAKADSFRVAQPSPGCSLTVNGIVTNVTVFGGNDGTISLTVTDSVPPPYTFLWNDAVTTQNRSSLSAGTYSVAVTDDSSCVANDTFTVTQPSPTNADIDFTSHPTHFVVKAVAGMSLEGAYYRTSDTSNTDWEHPPYLPLMLGLRSPMVNNIGTLAAIVNCAHPTPGDSTVNNPPGTGNSYDCDPTPGGEPNHTTCTAFFGKSFFNETVRCWRNNFNPIPMILFLNPQMTDTLQMKKEVAWEAIQCVSTKVKIGQEEQDESFPIGAYTANSNSMMDTISLHRPNCIFILDTRWWTNKNTEVTWRHEIKDRIFGGVFHVPTNRIEIDDYFWNSDRVDFIDTTDGGIHMVGPIDSAYTVSFLATIDSSQTVIPGIKMNFTQWGSRKGVFRGYDYSQIYETILDQFFYQGFIMACIKYNMDHNDYIQGCHYTSINDLINKKNKVDAHYNNLATIGFVLVGTPYHVSFTTTLDTTMFHMVSVRNGDTVKVLYRNEGTSSVFLNTVTIDSSAEITTFTGAYYKGVGYMDTKPNYHSVATSTGIQIQPYSYGWFYFIKPSGS